MKPLPRFEFYDSSTSYRFLVNGENDLHIAIGHVIIEEGLSTTAKVRGRTDLPKVYPYILIAFGDDEYDTLDLTAVSLTDFNQEQI